MNDNKEDMKILMKAMFDKGVLFGFKNAMNMKLANNKTESEFQKEWDKLQTVEVVEATLDEVFPLPKKRKK
jgi:hypothetical protein